VPNIAQEDWLMDATTKDRAAAFQKSGKPFVLLFWSRDPDMSQHNTKDSIGKLEPGINGPSAKAGTHNADTMLERIARRAEGAGLDGDTDIFVTADHRFPHHQP